MEASFPLSQNEVWQNIRSIKIMIWHMRNMRSISISIRSIVSSLDVLLLLMLDVGFGELDEFLTSWVHPWVVIATDLVANSTLAMWPSYIQVGTSYILNLFILLVLLRGNLWCGSFLLKLLHHIATVILSRLHLILLLQLVYFKFNLLDFSL
jgi:hypothetical protein